MVDWSAASTVGPAKPTRDRCWLARGTPDRGPAAEYFRTRRDAERRIHELLESGPERALVCFDFPYGTPHGSRLGGGRRLAARFDAIVFDHETGANNRFEVAAALNAGLDAGRPGPFWGCPAAKATWALPARRPPLDGRPFGEYRIVEERVRGRRRQIKSCWQLYGRGSVGGQMLLGLPVVHRLLAAAGVGARSRVWPFETDWDARLGGVVHAEIWPSLGDVAGQPHAIKDARQVLAMCAWTLELDGRGALRGYFARPSDLGEEDAEICRRDEGWILGVT